jgi:hypothetical protein
MGKVVTSEGLTEFVQSGKFTQVPNHKAGNGAAPLETVKGTPTIDVKPLDGAPALKADKMVNGEPEPLKAVETDDELTPEEQTLPEKIRKEIQRKNRAVNEKHKAMKEAQEERDASDRLAEQQYNERRLAEQRADAAEARAKELEAKFVPKEPELKEPHRGDFTDANGQIDWDKYTDAKADYRAKLAIQAERERLAGEQTEIARLAQIERLRQNAEATRKKHPDFDEVMTRIHGTAEDKVPAFVLNYIQESESSAEIAYHLAKNPEVSQKIAKMKPILGIAELGRLEDSLVKPPIAAANAPAAPSVTPRSERGGAPAPITPLDGEGSGGINTDPSKMTYKELRAYHRDQEREKRKH